MQIPAPRDVCPSRLRVERYVPILMVRKRIRRAELDSVFETRLQANTVRRSNVVSRYSVIESHSSCGRVGQTGLLKGD